MAYEAPIANTYYPHSCDAEMAVLSALTKDTQLLHTLRLEALDFYDTRNKMIFFSIQNLSNKLNEVTPADILDNLKSVTEVQKAGGEEHITKICSMRVNEYMLMDRVRSVQDHKIRRNAIVFGLDVIAKASGDSSSGDVLRGFVNTGLGKVFSELVEPTEKTGTVAMNDFLQKIADKKAGKVDKVLMCGLRPLDDFFNGQFVVQQTYVVLGATPSTGKSAFAGGLAIAWMEKGHFVFIASQEMKVASWINRMVAAKSGVHLTRINKGDFNNQAEEDLVIRTYEYITDLINRQGEIYHTSRMTPEMIQAKAMAFKRKHGGLSAILVDYLQRIKPNSSTAKKNKATHEEIAENSIAFKDMSSDLNCVVWVLSQLTLEDGSIKPALEHLRGSKDIGQDADIAILLNRAEDRRITEGCDIINVNIAKGRDVGTGEFQAKFESRFMRFKGMHDFEQPTEPISEEEWNAL